MCSLNGASGLILHLLVCVHCVCRSFVDAVGSLEEVEHKLERYSYDTKTRGHREIEPARLCGEARYSLIKDTHGNNVQTHLVYDLEVPEQPSEVQQAFNIAKEGQFLINGRQRHFTQRLALLPIPHYALSRAAASSLSSLSVICVRNVTVKNPDFNCQFMVAHISPALLVVRIPHIQHRRAHTQHHWRVSLCFAAAARSERPYAGFKPEAKVSKKTTSHAHFGQSFYTPPHTTLIRLPPHMC